MGGTLLAGCGLLHVSDVAISNLYRALDKAEAKAILAKELIEFTARPYVELVAAIKKTDVKNVVGESGVNYQIEIEAFWDSKPKEDLHILASIDDGGWRAFIPLTDSLIMKPDGGIRR